MLGPFAKLHDKVEGYSGPRSQSHFRQRRRLSRPVGRDEDVCGAKIALLFKKVGKTWRSDLLPHFDQYFCVEAQGALFFQDSSQSFDGDEMLSLVIGGAASIKPITVRRHGPRAHAAPPRFGEASDDVAMSIDQCGGFDLILDARRQQNRTAPFSRIFENTDVEAHLPQQRPDAFFAVTVKVGGPFR